MVREKSMPAIRNNMCKGPKVGKRFSFSEKLKAYKAPKVRGRTEMKLERSVG